MHSVNLMLSPKFIVQVLKVAFHSSLTFNLSLVLGGLAPAGLLTGNINMGAAAATGGQTLQYRSLPS